MRKITLEDGAELLDMAMGLMHKELQRMVDLTDGGEHLQVMDQKALVSYSNTLYQLNKDYRTSKRELEVEISSMSEEQLLAISDGKHEMTAAKILGIAKKN